MSCLDSNSGGPPRVAERKELTMTARVTATTKHVTTQKSSILSKLAAELSCWTMTRANLFRMGVEDAKAHASEE